MTEFYKKEDVIAFLNRHCPKEMWEYQIADLSTIKVIEYADKEQAYMTGYAEGRIARALHGDWTPVSEGLPKEREWGDGYVEPSDHVLVYGQHGNYGVSRYWGNRASKKEYPHRYPDWLDLDWIGDDVIAWRPLPEPYKKEDK